MSGVPEPLPWETSGFWALVYGAVLLVVLVRATWGKDDATRRLAARRVVQVAIALAVLAHVVLAWQAWSVWTGQPAKLRGRDPRESAFAFSDAFSLAGGVLAARVLTVLLASGFRRPRTPARRWHVPWEWPVAGGLVLLAALIEFHGRFDPRLPTGRHPATWTERAGYVGSVLAVVAALVVLQLVVAFARSRGPAFAERREALRDGLALWGFLLFAGALLMLEQGLAGLMGEVVILGPRWPGWKVSFEAWLDGSRLPMLLAFVGFVALCFGGLHLGRRRALEPEESPPSP